MISDTPNSIGSNFAQVVISGTLGPINISYNELTYNDDFNENHLHYGITIDDAENIEVFGNEIHGFSTGITLFESEHCRVYENRVINAIENGIYAESIDDIDISCNLIDLQYTGSSIGIYVLTQGALNNKIYSNCVFDCHTSISIEGSGQMPDIKNNYLYNYTVYGILLDGVNGSIGAAPTSNIAGRNSFFSNNTFNNAWDIYSTIPGITVGGNFNIANVGPGTNVSGSYSNQFNSTASCANQEDVTNGQYLFDEPCSGEEMMGGMFTTEGDGITFNNDYMVRLKTLSLEEHTFIPLLILAASEEKLNEDFKALVLSKIHKSEKIMANFYIGLLEKDKINALGALNILEPTVSRERRVILTGLYELCFYQTLPENLTSQIIELMNNDSKNYNTLASLLQSSNQGINQDFKISSTKRRILHTVENLSLYPSKSNFSVYPNPSSSELNILYNFPEEESESMLVLSDLQGRVVMTYDLEFDFDEKSINIADLKSGVYFVSIKSGNSVVSKKFIKQ